MHVGRVDQLEASDGSTGGDGSDSRAARRLERRERDADRHDVLGDPVEPECELGDHAERALGADEKTRQVVAGRGLGGLRPGPDDRATW